MYSLSKKNILYILVFVIIVFLAFLFYNFLSDKKNYAFSVKKDNIEVVVARYKEDISWVYHYFPHQKVTVYNKGPDITSKQKNVKIVKLPNVGRESHTYLSHIILNYDNLKPFVVFFQGNPFDHGGDILLGAIRNDAIIKGKNFQTIINGLDSSLFNEKKLKKEAQSLRPEKLSQTSWANTYYKNPDQDIIDYAKSVDIKMKDTFAISYGAQFMVSASNIHNHPVSYYEKIRESLSHHVAPIEGHYIERLWDLIFAA